MLGYAMHSLHYTDEQALNSSVVHLRIAYDFGVESGKSTGTKTDRQAQQDVAMQMRGFAVWHNATRKQKAGDGMR